MNFVQYCEFYITNVCNLTCSGCNRFNNHKFTGYQLWNDYKDEYTKWSKELTFNSMAILGGEPMLNPDFMKWVIGIRNLWPTTQMRIITNGYQLPKIKGFYEHLVADRRTRVCVGIHNKLHKKTVLDIVKNFLSGPLKYDFNHDEPWFITITDINLVRIRVEFNWWFHQGALIEQPQGFALHDSNVEKAHATCNAKTCHHFIRGKLYKCGVAALLPEFAQQHKIFLSDQDTKLMNSYIPLSISDSIETKKIFINNLSNSIPQCKFCPENYDLKQIFSEIKKSKYAKE